MGRKNKRKAFNNTMPIIDKTEKPYRFGTGISIIDENVINGPDVQRAVNNQMLVPEDEKADDRITE